MAATATKFAWPGVPTALATIVAVADPTPITVAGVGLVSAAAVAVVAYRTSKNHDHIAGTDNLVDHLQEQLTSEVARREVDRRLIDDQRTRQARLERRMLDLELGARRLTHQLEQLGHEPVWRPDHPTRPSGESTP